MTPITPENLPLLKLVLAVLLGALTPLLGFLAGGTVAAVLLEIYGGEKNNHRKLAAALFARTLQGQTVALPTLLLVAAALACAGLVYPETGLGPAFAAASLLPLAVGLALLHLRPTLTARPSCPAWLGSAVVLTGAGALFAAMFVLLSGLALLLHPDQWPHLGRLPWLILSWNGLARFLEILVLSFGLTGAVILLCAAAEGGSTPGAEGFRRFACRTGAVLALVSLLAWPPLQLWGLYTLAGQARSGFLFALAIAALAVGLGLALILLNLLETSSPALAKPALLGFLALFLTGALSDHNARGTHLNEQTLPQGRARAAAFYPKAAALPEPPSTAAPAPAPSAAAADGEAVFQRICAGCHAFDRRVVGPPLNSVLGKYQGRLAELKGFIRKPVKINPDYPSMPQLGLAEPEIDAVARYLLQRAGE
ncbi:hypothetical protein DESUT3_03580 [Desulfuromonas versatilis]|uniref:Cytochrome c domain-containing protein n=1 Tax=Desulfuromonas versatilis TaxID=2802975 RepID=A0ABM8HS63_9BACT|nr:c-type cytochrome [Desulfuromonas versatilis]BCR03289.1 hypothetical protein DESUT3_03580 [Desulfuromonas versatilis]